MKWIGKAAAIALGLWLVSPRVWAQAVPVYFAEEIKGRIVDEDTGRPLEEVLIVARWDWLEAYFTLHGDPYRNRGDAIHIAEAVTDKDGNYVIPEWGPKSKGAGRLDDLRDPQLSIFKSGYVPLELVNDWADYRRHNPANVRTSRWNGKLIKLKPFTGTPKEYAEKLAKFADDYDRGLRWRHQSDNWKAMPRMILAMHREKVRLGADGDRVHGVNELFGRSGRGELLDAQTGKPVWPAIINITWTMRRAAGDTTSTRRLVEQKRSGAEGYGNRFYVSPWRLPAPRLRGWEVALDQPPLVRIYAAGYRRLPDMKWEERGAALHMQKLPDTKEALLEELSAWRRDIEAEFAASSDRKEALAAQQDVLRLLSDQCDAITPDVRKGICFESDSEVARYLEQFQSVPVQSRRLETRAGTPDTKVVPVERGPAVRHSVAVPVSKAPTVGGFSIEPSDPAPDQPSQ